MIAKLYYFYDKASDGFWDLYTLRSPASEIYYSVVPLIKILANSLIVFAKHYVFAVEG